MIILFLNAAPPSSPYPCPHTLSYPSPQFSHQHLTSAGFSEVSCLCDACGLTQPLYLSATVEVRPQIHPGSRVRTDGTPAYKRTFAPNLGTCACDLCCGLPVALHSYGQYPDIVAAAAEKLRKIEPLLLSWN
ncbi:hypothetical protein ElyMa_002607300 [Elysia marginata]|uniref:Uncharacterized protein n=1 Tax=Elysia marginata TaxID=1093978 RepID=A0AAV4H3X2_9GAST|nr:hypothetical protein ElyMa_002607300 [Elysia marginata]